MKWAALLCLLSAPAFAQGYVTPACLPPDVLEIRDDGDGRAIVTYGNSVNNCSMEQNRILTSPNGIEVRVRIELLGREDEFRERITLEPLTDGMFAIPPEGDLLDGETREFLIQGGIS
jgi:hypothetical protein